MNSLHIPAAAALLLSACATMKHEARPEVLAATCTSDFEPRSREVAVAGVLHASGLAVADVDADGFQDLVVASGGDTAPGPVSIHFGKPGVPDWQSADRAYNARVVAGDLNHDGFLDLAVAVFPPPAQMAADVPMAKVYLSSGGRLDPNPLLIPVHQAGVYSPSVALGDANGDGYLDLAVTTLLSAAAQRSIQLIYYNRAGTLDLRKPWLSQTKVQANAVRFLDFDQDGLMDLLVTAPTRQWGWLFSGRRDPDGSVGIAPTATTFEYASNVPSMLYTVDADVSAPGEDSSLHLYTPHSDHYCFTDGCKGFLAAHDHRGDTRWVSEAEEGMVSAVAVGRLDGDEVDDVVANFWRGDRNCTPAQNCPMPGPLLAYCDASAGGFIRTGERLLPNETFLVERMVLSDLDGSSTSRATYVVPNGGGTPRFVVTLPVRNIMGVVSVSRNQSTLGSRDYAFVPGNNWIAFAEPLEPGEHVEISYTWTSAPDLIIADTTRQGLIPVIYRRR